MWVPVRSQMSQTRNCEPVIHNAFLSEVTQTPCSHSRPCPDGGPCLEYGGAYLCTCQTSGAELDHKDFYPYGKSLRHQPNNTALCSYVSLHEQLVSIATNIFLKHTGLHKCRFLFQRGMVTFTVYIYDVEGNSKMIYAVERSEENLYLIQSLNNK